MNVSLNISVTQANQQTWVAVLQEYALGEKAGKYGWRERNRPDDVVQVMYKNFSSLGLFVERPARHKKVGQLNKLMADYGIDVLAGCETWTDWQFIKKEDDRFCNLFDNGQPTPGSHTLNINDYNIKRDQWGGTGVTASGRFASFVTLQGAETTGLGRWSWIYVGGGGKLTRVIVAYQPCSPKNRRTMGETVWDQHLCYFKSRGESGNLGQCFITILSLSSGSGKVLGM